MPRLVIAFLLTGASLWAESELSLALDKTANPCEDFAQYACGGWFVRNPMPADRTRWGHYDQLRDRTQGVLKELLETAASQPKDAIDRKIGGYYAACVDEAAIDALGLAPIKHALDRIQAILKPEELAVAVARLNAAKVNALFNFTAAPDYKNAAKMLADLDQGGLTLPDPDYYLKDEPRYVALRKKYLEHMGHVFDLLGYKDVEDRAKAVLNFETALAKGSMDRVSRRDPANLYHVKSLAELSEMAPSFSWSKYFTALGAPPFQKINVEVPGFVTEVEKLIHAAPLSDWTNYLVWRYAATYADVLPKPFRDAAFDFTGRTLTGVKEQLPRWKRCVAMTDRHLGEALGQKYVAKYFPPGTKAEVLQLVHEVEKAFEKDVHSLAWMSDATKKKAIEKLRTLSNKIGYPERWRDYSTVEIEKNAAFANFRSAARYETRRDLRRIGKPTDKSEWGMTPPTVNAYYNSSTNDINFPAARLQPPFYHPKGDLSGNYGGIAAVIGHELTHGFDDEGRKSDKDGNLNEWWTEADAKAFEERAQCFVDQYSAYSAIAEIKVNGKLTLGENTADNGGVRLAYMALREALVGKPRNVIDGLTPEQRFFISYAHTRCDTGTDEARRLRALTDPHSPGQYRINGVVSNMPEFWQAFGCKEGQPMVREKACRVW